MTRWTIGITGASGIRYALRLLDILEKDKKFELHVVVSDSALRVLHEEEQTKTSGSTLTPQKLIGRTTDRIMLYSPKDIGAPIASGTFITDGMVIIPCSMSTLGSIAHGVHSHLIHRAADVVIKEGRRLIMVPRETPLSPIHLENMLKLSRLGVTMIPAMPGFYHKPKTVDDLVDMMVMKVLDSMGIQKDLVRRWE